MSLNNSTDDVTEGIVHDVTYQCPLVSSLNCPVKTNTMEEMIEHINFHLGENYESEQGMDQGDERGEVMDQDDEREEVIEEPKEKEPLDEEENKGKKREEFEENPPREQDNKEKVSDGTEELEKVKKIKYRKKQGKIKYGAIKKKESNGDEYANNVNEENGRSGGKKSNVPKAHDSVVYKGYPVKYWLVHVNGMVESAEKNLLDIEHGRTKMKWNKSMYYEWLHREIPDSNNWTKETLRKRTSQIDESSERFVTSKEPTTEEEKNIATMRKKFNELKKCIGEARPAEKEQTQAAGFNGVKMPKDDDESEDDQSDKVNKKLESTLQKKKVDYYDYAQNLRDSSVRKNAEKSRLDGKVADKSRLNKNINEEDVGTKISQIIAEKDVDKKVSKLVDMAVETFKNPQPANLHNVYGGFPPYPAMFGPPPHGYYPNMMPGMFMNPMGMNQTSSGENLGEGSVPPGRAGGPPMPPVSEDAGPSSPVGGTPAGAGGLPPPPVNGAAGPSRPVGGTPAGAGGLHTPPVNGAAGPSSPMGGPNGYSWPSGVGWPATSWPMYSPGPGWPMAGAPANWNMSHFSQTPPHASASPSGAWPMPNVPGWYRFPGYTSNPPGPAEMPSPSAPEVPPVSAPGIIGSPSSEPSPSMDT